MSAYRESAKEKIEKSFPRKPWGWPRWLTFGPVSGRFFLIAVGALLMGAAHDLVPFEGIRIALMGIGGVLAFGVIVSFAGLAP